MRMTLRRFSSAKKFFGFTLRSSGEMPLTEALYLDALDLNSVYRLPLNPVRPYGHFWIGVDRISSARGGKTGGPGATRCRLSSGRIACPSLPCHRCCRLGRTGNDLKITKRNLFIVAALLIGAALLLRLWLGGSENISYSTSSVERGDIFQVVDATGTINAVTTVQVGSQVSGVISELHADFNSHVSKGDVIARIEPALFQGAFAQAKADLESAKANVAAAAANTAKAKSAEAQMKADYERNIGLTKSGAVSQQAFELAKANAESANAQVAAAEAQELQARAQVDQKQAAVQVAQTNLDYTTIRAPIDGTVVARTVDVGQTVAASLQAPTLFTIAQDLTKMQVYAKTDESDVGGMKRGQRLPSKSMRIPVKLSQGPSRK